MITEELPESPDDESDSGGHVGNPFDLLDDDDEEHENDQVLLLACATLLDLCPL